MSLLRRFIEYKVDDKETLDTEENNIDGKDRPKE